MGGMAMNLGKVTSAILKQSEASKEKEGEF